jgi:hypothetical protein
MKRLLVLLALLLPVSALQAQEAEVLPFTRIDRDPVQAGLAGAGAAYSGTVAFKAFSDAAVLPFFEGKLDAGVSYQRWAPGTAAANHVNAGVAVKPLSWLAVSAGYAFQAGRPYEITNAIGQPEGWVHPQSHVAVLGVGIGLGRHWSLGANVRYAQEKTVGRNAAFSADISAAWQPLVNLRFTAGVSTLGPGIVSEDGSSYKQPASARLGACWGLALGESHKLDVMADADFYFSRRVAASLGVQYAWKQMVFVRGGYRLASDSCAVPGHLALGAGVCFKGFRLDVSYLTASKALGNSLCAGIGYAF